MAYNNKQIFDNYINNNNIDAITELNDLKLKVYIDGASTAIFENMVRLESLSTMRQFARVYNLEDMQTAKQRLSRLLPNEVKEVSKRYADLMNNLNFYGKDLYAETLDKKGFDPYVFGMALFQFEMSKYGMDGNNLFASLISKSNVIDRDGIKKLILPYLYGSKLESVLVKALVLNIPNHNRNLYSLLKRFTQTESVKNNKNLTEQQLKQMFREFLLDTSYRGLLNQSNDKPLKFGFIRSLLTLSSNYNERAKELINSYLNVLESQLQSNPLQIRFEDVKNDERLQNGARGYYNGEEVVISSNLRYEPEELLSVLLHELGHVYFENINAANA
ncbi:MAG TPA: hypothetical protein DCW90_11820, partial [Lachnospiraceae bacterium]|nr:hypothetical protein [Lachnospiraceae bacterium]